MKYILALALLCSVTLRAAVNPLVFGGYPVLNITNYGRVFNGVADNATVNDSALATALSSLRSGEKLFLIGNGTNAYIFNNATIASSADIIGVNNPIVRHRTNASGNMWVWSAPSTGLVEGITFDANLANQGTNNFHALLYPYGGSGSGLRIRNNTFNGFMEAAILDFQTTGTLEVTGNAFLNGYAVATSHTNSWLVNSAMWFAPGIANNRPRLIFKNNTLSNAPVVSGTRLAGGVALFGSESVDHYNYAEVENNRFYNSGGNTSYGAYHVGTATIDWYRSTVGFAKNNFGTNGQYYFIKVQQSQDVVIEGNRGHSTGEGVYTYTPMERDQVAPMKRAVFRDNWAYTGSNDTIGFYLNAGSAGGFYDVLVDGFYYPPATRGMQIEGFNDTSGAVQGFGPVTLRNVHLHGSGYGLQVRGMAGRLKIEDSVLEGTNSGSGLFMVQTNTASTVMLDNVTARSYGAGWGARVWGVNGLHVRNSRFEALGAGEAIELQDDADGNNIGTLTWERSNSTSGTVDMVTADIDAGHAWLSTVVTHFPSGWTLTMGNGSSSYFEEKRHDFAGQILGTRWRNLTPNGSTAISLGAESASLSLNIFDDTAAGSFPDMALIQAESDASALVLRSVSGDLHLRATASGQTIDFYSGSTTLSGRFNSSGNLEANVLATGSSVARSLPDHVTGGVINLANYIHTNYTGAQNLAGIMEAWNYARTIAAVHPKLVAPAGEFVFSDTIEFTNQINGIRIEGAGKHSTYFRAGAAMDRLFRMGLNGNAFDGRNMVTGITFDGNSLADIVVDFSAQSYSDFYDNEVIRPAAGGTCVLAGMYANTFAENIIHGNGIGMGLVFTNQPFNQITVMLNQIMFCTIPLVVPQGLQDMHIALNDFEGNAGPLWFRAGAQNLTFEHNYVEATGLTNPVPVEVSSGVFSNYYGAVVFSHLYNAVSDTTYRNLIVRGNTYANNSTSAILTIDNVIGGHIYDDLIYPTYTHTNYVHLRGKGSPYSTARGLTIDYTDVGDSVITPIGFNYLDDREEGSAGLKIQARDKIAYSNFPKIGGAIWGNPASWQQFGTTGSISVGRDGSFEGYKVWKAERSSGSDYYFFKIFTNITTGSISSIDGHRYIRIQYATKGDAGAANGLQVSAIVDGVTQILSDRTSETWRAAENLIVHLPPGVNTFQLAATPVTGVLPCWFTKFTIEDASSEFGVGEVLTEMDFFPQTAVVPTYGSWTNGDKVFYKAASTTGYIGAICTVTGSPGTWAEFGPISSGFTTIGGQFDNNATAGNTRFLIYDVDNGTLERVSVGVADSGGAGFKVLRIPN